jgi:CelD/BcsL family acetyltransferase involved in cellulose biosynthesis
MSQSDANHADLRARVVRTAAAIRELSSGWRELFQRCRANPFQSPEWLLPWIEVFSPEKMLLVEIRSGEHLVGLAPLLIYRRDSNRVLAFMGGGVSDYLDVLVDPEFESEVVFEIGKAVLNATEDWNLIDLTDLPHHSSLLTEQAFKSEAREHDSCSTLQLPQTNEELLHLFSKRQRSNLRNAHSRLQRAGGGEVQIATRENIAEFLEDLFALHGSRWSERGETGVLSDPKVRSFHKSCAPRLLEAKLLHLSRLRLKQRTVAVIYSLLDKETVFCYLQGFDPEFGFLSPGTHLMFSVMSDTLERGMREFDFLRGCETYKQHWQAENKPTYRIQLTRRDLAALLSTKLSAMTGAAEP